MAENGSIPISDGNPQNGAGSEADEPSSQAKPPPRQPRTDRADAFTFSAWLLEGVVGLCEELQHSDLGLPEEFWTHAYAAGGAVGGACFGQRRDQPLRGGRVTAE